MISRMGPLCRVTQWSWPAGPLSAAPGHPFTFEPGRWLSVPAHHGALCTGPVGPYVLPGCRVGTCLIS